MQLVNQRAKLRCDLWRPDFRPPDKGHFKTERPYTVKCGVGGTFQNGTGSRAIVKRDTPPGWTAVLTGGITIRSPLARVPCFGAPYALK